MTTNRIHPLDGDSATRSIVRRKLGNVYGRIQNAELGQQDYDERLANVFLKFLYLMGLAGMQGKEKGVGREPIYPLMVVRNSRLFLLI